MHRQTYQGTQQYQAHYGYAVNHNQYGQPVGNSQLNEDQTPSSSLNRQGYYTPSQPPLFSQHGTNASKANYHGNGSYGMSSSNQNPLYPPAVPTSACIPGSSNEYNIQPASAKNLQMVQPHQRAQSTQMPSSGPAQTWHVKNNTQSVLAQNKPRETAQHWCLLNNSQTNMNVTTPNQRLQGSNGQPQIAVNNLNVSRYPHQAQTLQLQQSSYQSDSSMNNHNRSSYPCQALQLKQASNQAQAQIPTANIHYILNQGRYGQMKHSQCSLKTSKVEESLQSVMQGNKMVVQLYPPNPVHREQQNIQTNSILNTEGCLVQPVQNYMILSGMNGENLTQVSSQSSYCTVNRQILRRNSTATSPTMASSPLRSNVPNSAPVSSANRPPPSCNAAILSCSSAHTNQNSPSSEDNSPKLASPVLYTNILTSSLLVPSGINRLQSPHSQTHSLATLSNNMNTSSSGSCGLDLANVRVNGCPLPPHLLFGSPNSFDTNQTDPTTLGNLSRNAGGAPTHSSSSSVHAAPVQQQSPPLHSAQQRLSKQQLSQRNIDVYNHTPNMADKLALPRKSLKALTDKNPQLMRLLATDSMKNTNQNIKCKTYNAPIMPVSPSRSVQTHRVVAIVPPISKQPAGGDKSKKCNDHLSLLIKEIRSLTNEKETEEEDVDMDCAAAMKTLPGVTSSVIGCPPEDDVTYKSSICSKTNPLLNKLSNLSSEKKGISKDENSEQLCESSAFFGIPVVTFSLRMVRELVVGLELTEEDQGKTNESGMIENTPDFARAILDLYWGGNYANYVETELGGTFADVLKEAAEFDTDEDVIVFDAMKVGDLNQLNQMGCTLTNFSDGDIPMEMDKSPWRNKGNEPLDTGKKLSDADVMRQVCGTLHCKEKSVEQHSDIQSPATRPLNEDSVSKKDPQPPSVAKSDTVSLHNENCTVMAMQPEHVKFDRQAELKQNVAIPTTSKNNRQDDSRKDNKEDYLPLQVQVSSGNLNGHSHQNQAPADPPRDTVDKTPEKYENRSSTKRFRGGSDWTVTLKTTNLSEDSINLGHNSQDTNCKKYLTEEDCTVSVALCEQVEPSEKECETTPCDTVPHIKLTVLSSDMENKKVENQHQDLIGSGQRGPPSPIVISEHSSESDLGSPKSLDDPVLSMKITVLSKDELKSLSVEFYSDSENSVHNVGMSSPICVDSEDDGSSVHTCQTDGETIQMTKQEEISTLTCEEVPSIHSIKEALSLLQTSVTENQNNHMDHSAENEPTSPLKDSRKRKDTQERHLQNEYQHPSQSCHSPPLKKCRVEPLGDFEKSVKLAAALSPSGQSAQDMATNYSPKSDADMTRTPDNKVQRDNAASLSATLVENVLNLAHSSKSPEMPTSSSVDKKRKSVKFKLYGAQKLGLKEGNGKTEYYTDSDHNLPPFLNILFSPDKTSARDKIKKSWEDSFVPAPIKFRRRSGLVSENMQKDVLERPVEWCQKSSGQKKQRSSGKEHQLNQNSSKDEQQRQQQSSKTKHKKYKHMSLSLTKLRREAEKMGKYSRSPQEKQTMGLHILKQYKRIHKKM